MSEDQPLLPPDVESDSSDLNYSRPTLWRHKTSKFLDSSPLHKTVIGLARTALVSTLSLSYAACVLADLGYTFLSDNCTPEGPDAPLWLGVLAHISFAITTVFLVEIPLALWAFGLQYYNPFGPVIHAPLHMFDAVIILSTFTIEVGLKGRERELASLLIILRLWRLVKLVGGIAVGAGEINEEDAKELATARQELEVVRAQLRTAQGENQQLRRRLQETSI